MSATGNDFIIFDARVPKFPKFDRALFSQAICRRQASIGADGVIFIEKAKDKSSAFKWDFYNSDGSVAEMCGNAARCMGRYATEYEIADDTFSFESLAGVINVHVRPKGFVEVDMPKLELINENLQIPLQGEMTKLMFWNTGVPHVVLETAKWDEEWLLEVGRYLRSHPFFKNTNGTNVTFFEAEKKDLIHSASFERGVEGITLACGTGAVAAVATALRLKKAKTPADVLVPGGQITVNITKDGKAQLGGETRLICEGVVFQEALL